MLQKQSRNVLPLIDSPPDFPNMRQIRVADRFLQRDSPSPPPWRIVARILIRSFIPGTQSILSDLSRKRKRLLLHESKRGKERRPGAGALGRNQRPGLDRASEEDAVSVSESLSWQNRLTSSSVPDQVPWLV